MRRPPVEEHASTQEVLTGWGGTVPTMAEVVSPAAVEDLATLVAGRPRRGVLARGLGRSYGDAAQNAGGLVARLDRLDAIGPVDRSTGRITCGAGVSLDRLIRTLLPLGWFVPVTPGTRQVTLGGAVAADVHGKNHHRDGTLSAHVVSLTLVDGRGQVRTLAPDDDLFWAVPGGMGLSGIVVEVTLQLLPVGSGHVVVDTTRTASLDETMETLEEADRTHRYSVAWVDCLSRGARMGRGVVTAGEHAGGDDALAASRPDGRQGRWRPVGGTTVAVPRWAPGAPLNPVTVGLFNELYHRRAPRLARSIEPIGTFFHPLDAVQDWNRLYGPRGVVQHQCTVGDAEAMRRVIGVFANRRAPTFLCVLKRFGAEGRGPLSFPQPGWTLAVDLPVGSDTAGVLDEVDAVVLSSGGRVYLAKDSRVLPAAFSEMYPRLDDWRHLRDQLDPDHVFRSDLSRRLHL
ncbi:FAD-binding oxidoreductase [Terrabacter sp. NPDC080008]|uniref:FAD-binding oxidoreductase n=1 Tax=Terrabacter sp. NPDC080008 TaxID=3155176 RepID=UPI00344B3C5C